MNVGACTLGSLAANALPGNAKAAKAKTITFLMLLSMIIIKLKFSFAKIGNYRHMIRSEIRKKQGENSIFHTSDSFL